MVDYLICDASSASPVTYAIANTENVICMSGTAYVGAPTFKNSSLKQKPWKVLFLLSTLFSYIVASEIGSPIALQISKFLNCNDEYINGASKN